MNKVKSIILPLLLTVFNAGICGQEQHTDSLPPEVMAWTKSTLGPWSYKQYKSLKEAIIDNEVYIPTVFRGGMFPKLEFKDCLDMPEPDIPPAYSLGDRYTAGLFSSFLIRKSLEDEVYREMTKNPLNFKYSIYQFPDRHIKPASIEKPVHDVKIPETIVLKKAAPESVGSDMKFIPDRRYWTSSFTADVKFSQNASSFNWHQGKLESMNINTYTLTTYNYARGKITLANTLTTQFQIVTAPNDTLRDYTFGADELRFRSNFGLQAIKNWSYSLSAEFITSMGNKYIVNTQNKHSAFLSPYTIILGCGITYVVAPKFKKPNRSLNLTLSIEPIAFTFMYSNNKNINLGAFFPRNEDGTPKFVTRSFGPHVTLTNNVKFNKSINLYTRLYYFTNYELVKGDLENKLDISLSRYFSTTLHVWLRYDDSVKKKREADSFFQLYEAFSFGFKYTW
jgi:hypothetical protein